jgi:excisionase family DNA binding protein
MVDVKYLTVPEVAEILRVSRSRAYEMVQKGYIPCVRLGRTIRIPAHRLPGMEGFTGLM